MSDVVRPQPQSKEEVRGLRNRGLRIANSEHKPYQKTLGSPIWYCRSENPSESGVTEYVINIDRRTCECKYFRAPGKSRTACKHIYAVLIERAKVYDINPEPVPNPYKNPSYYNVVKRNEEASVRELLRCLAERAPTNESAA